MIDYSYLYNSQNTKHTVSKGRDIYSTIVKSFVAGLLIGLACIVSCQCSYPEIIFPVGLICIMYSNSLLYTGCIGHYSSKDYHLLLIIVGNLLGVLLPLYYTRYLNINLLYPIIDYKYNESYLQYSISSIFCGMLMCTATSLNKNKNILVILFCVAAFIISKLDHSIANMFYLGIDGYDLHDILLIIIALVGNGVGAKLLYVSYNMVCKQGK